MDINILNINDKIRGLYDKLFDSDINELINFDDSLCGVKIIDKLLGIRTYNKDLFEYLIKVGYIDTYRHLEILKESHDFIDDEDFLYKTISSINNFNELLCIVEEDSSILIDFILNSIINYNSNYLENRCSIMSTQHINNKLGNVTKISIIDEMFYCSQIDTNKLYNIYKEKIDKNNYGKNIIGDIIIYLYNNDRENYESLVFELIKIYYKTVKYKCYVEKSLDYRKTYLDIIDTSENSELKEFVYDNPNFFDKIINMFLEYKLSNDKAQEIDRYIIHNVDEQTNKRFNFKKNKSIG